MILFFFFFAVEFYERRPKKAWFSKAEEKVCWEQWVLNVTLVTIKTDSGRITFHPTASEEVPTDFFPPDRARARASLEHQLQKAVLEIITTASLRKDHIPPITTNDLNPFPYQIVVSPKGETWGARMGIF
jgi:autophagy-related protein 101